MQYKIFAEQWIWKGLDERVLLDIYASGDTLEISSDQVVMSEGDEPSDFYIVLSGQCEVYLPDSPRRVSEVTLATLVDGDAFGEYTYFDQEPVSASVRAVTPTTLFRVSHRSLENLVRRDAVAGLVIYQNILVSLVRRLRKQNEELDLFSLPVDDFA